MKVILAEESRVVRSFLRAGLRSTRYAEAPLDEVRSGAELLKSMKKDVDPDTLVLLDWNLPGMDVPTLLAHLERKETIDRISILLCVNSSEVPLAEQAVRNGARGLISRPFTDQELAAKVEELARRRPVPASAAASNVLRDIVTTVRAQEELPSLLSLPSAILSQLFEHTSSAHFEAGDVMVRAGDRIDSLSFVTSGEVEIGGPEGQVRRGTGECYGEREFVCGEPAKRGVRALTAVDVVSVAKETMVDLARRHPALQDFLTVLLTRRAGAPSAEGESELAGTLTSLPFPDLLQFLNSTRKTGVLILEDAGRQGRIYFERGEVCDARAEGEAGEPAFACAARWQNARFEFKTGASSDARTIHQSTMKLLMTSFLPAQEAAAESHRCAMVG